MEKSDRFCSCTFSLKIIMLNERFSTIKPLLDMSWAAFITLARLAVLHAACCMLHRIRCHLRLEVGAEGNHNSLVQNTRYKLKLKSQQNLGFILRFVLQFVTWVSAYLSRHLTWQLVFNFVFVFGVVFCTSDETQTETQNAKTNTSRRDFPLHRTVSMTSCAKSGDCLTAICKSL